MWVTLAVLSVWLSTARGQFDPFSQFGGKLTAERGGPPRGAQFLPIAVVQFAPGRAQRPINRYKPGQPPPPPPDRPVFPTKQPKPSRPQPSPPKPPQPPPEEPSTEAPPALGNQDALPAYYHRFLQNDDLSYYFDFQAANKITRSEQGFFKSDGVDLNPILVKTGTYSYTSPEGIPFQVNYVADERGYRTYPTRP